MTAQDRVQAVVDYGFTERQARFLVLVMRHSGLCVKRQYAAFAGIANGGEKCNAFFAKLVRRGFAMETACIHNRAHLYHVHSKPLYHAIEEPDSRYRRTVPARVTDERLMRLDAELISPDVEWLTTRSEKLAYPASRTAADAREAGVDAPVREPANAANQFPGTFPIGIDPSGAPVPGHEAVDGRLPDVPRRSHGAARRDAHVDPPARVSAAAPTSGGCLPNGHLRGARESAPRRHDPRAQALLLSSASRHRSDRAAREPTSDPQPIRGGVWRTAFHSPTTSRRRLSELLGR